MLNKYIHISKISLSLLLANILSLNVAIAADQPTVIALFGDSITVGRNEDHPNPTPPKDANGTTTNGLPTTLLRDLLASQNRNAIVANWGLGGSTSVSGVNRISGDLNTNTTQNSNGSAYIVLIMYGTNDFNDGGISRSATAINIGLMIDGAELVGYTPIIGTITPRSDQYGEVVARNAKIVSTVNSKGKFIVDHHALFLQTDPDWESLIDIEFSAFTGTSFRLHPNDDGYAAIAQNWFDERLIDIIKPEVNVAPIIYLLMED